MKMWILSFAYQRQLHLLMVMAFTGCIVVVFYQTQASTKRSSVFYQTANRVTEQNGSAEYSMCVIFQQRLGNNMFQYASNFGTAANKNMSLIISDKGMFHNIFKVTASIQPISFIRNHCVKRHEKRANRYDENLVDFAKSNNYALMTYLQSWKYFIREEEALHKEFTFTDEIQTKRDKFISSILQKRNHTSRQDVNFIGIHIRRPDRKNATGSGGRVFATPGYLKNAVHHFLSKNITHTIFVVCSSNIGWSGINMPKHIEVEYSTGNSAAVDLAILGSCDHLISTTGTFGWWAGWLTRGEVTYFMWPARKGSAFRKLFDANFTDFFYPGWIGIA